MSKTLKDVVASLCGRAPQDIKPDSSLDSIGLEGSLKRAALVAAIRRGLGLECLAAATAKTFGELEAAVAGAAPPPSSEPDGPPAAVDRNSSGCGIDLESTAFLPQTLHYASHEFYRRHFSEEEIAYCAAQSDPRTHFAARWCAKEALRKCDGTFIDVPARELSLQRDASGRIALSRAGLRLPHAVSVTHAGGFAAAVVIAPQRRWPAWVALAVSLAALAAALLR